MSRVRTVAAESMGVGVTVLNDGNDDYHSQTQVSISTRRGKQLIFV